LSSTFKNLTKEFMIRRGQWIYVVKVVEFDGNGEPVLNIAKFQYFGKKRIFRAEFNMGKPFWRQVLGEGGLISSALTAWVGKQEKKEDV